jgi:beta-lactamase superfamily II metal-dependent hydrolase
MKKIVIFNVGGALSTYAEIDDRKIIIDLGASCDFSPVEDFLIPLAEKQSFKKSDALGNTDKYHVDQLFLSHLDKDHISDYEKFREKFHPHYMTCPNDNEKQDSIFKIVKDFFTGENKVSKLVLSDMNGRTTEAPNTYGMSRSNPLVSTVKEINLYYIKPAICQEEDNLKSSYANNISLVLFIILNEKTVLLPGDILKEGMEYLIDNDSDFKTNLNNVGIDFLIAPHHGLVTSFSERLFQEINGNKTRLNIISEKTREEDSEENRSDVDRRYYDSNYSTGENSLNQNGVKTSMGHIVIDLETDEKEIKQYANIQDVMNEFTI